MVHRQNDITSCESLILCHGVVSKYISEITSHNKVCSSFYALLSISGRFPIYKQIINCSKRDFCKRNNRSYLRLAYAEMFTTDTATINYDFSEYQNLLSLPKEFSETDRKKQILSFILLSISAVFTLKKLVSGWNFIYQPYDDQKASTVFHNCVSRQGPVS